MASKTKKSKDGEAPEETSDTGDPVRERQLYLQEECRILALHLDTYLGRAEQLLQGSKHLEKEAQGTQEQSQSYLSCGAKLSQDPPGMVITLNDQNCQDLARIQEQKEELIPRYAGKEQEVRSALKDTEAEASLLDTELEELEPYKEQKVQAEQKVKALEKELRVTRIRCAEETHTPDPCPHPGMSWNVLYTQLQKSWERGGRAGPWSRTWPIPWNKVGLIPWSVDEHWDHSWADSQDPSLAKSWDQSWAHAPDAGSGIRAGPIPQIQAQPWDAVHAERSLLSNLSWS
uniref:DUF4515 domain-containing protein n=1 Tax=Cyanistes caeruleus TaxID=156563 RepID=A0A8C0V025_CYACU